MLMVGPGLLGRTQGGRRGQHRSRRKNVPANAVQRDRYWDAASDHLAWCRDHGVDVIDGRWDLEDPISGLLLAAVLARSSARSVLNIVCRSSWEQVRVSAAWWPSSLVDLVVNFVADGVRYMLVLEN